MEIRVSLVVPLSGEKDSFKLTGPCACCGKPGARTWENKNVYELKQWQAGEKGPILAGYKTESGERAEGIVELEVPYCEEHYQQTLRLRRLQSSMNWTIGLVSLLVTILVFVNISLDRFEAAQTTTNAGFWLCASPIIVAAATAFVMLVITQGIQTLLQNQPKNAEFPLEGLSGGGSGLRIETREDGGAPGRGLIRYYLDLGFLNPEAARQFITSFPNSKVSKGQELLTG